ncbi:sulfatase [Polaribacter sp.]|uniref:sulfatase n=1 Tax=Polaribacter sp. TaxID=1920175 RepID=UPI003F699C85
MFTLKKIIVCTLFVSALHLVSCRAQSEKTKEKQPNVLFIMVDDLNDYQGVYGGHPQAKTPHIDNFAASSTVFTNAHTNVPVCQPSRNSLFSGVYPHKSKDFGWTPHTKQAYLKDKKTFIELFKENGYQTFGTGKLMHKNSKNYWTEWGVPEGINYGPHAYSGVDEKGKRIMGHSSVPEPFRSINVVDGSFASLSDTPVITDKNENVKKTGWTYGNQPFRYNTDNDRDLMPDEQHAKWIVNKIKELEASETKKPFFMGVGFVKPHTPLYAPKKYFDKFPLDNIQLPKIKENDADDTGYTSVYPETEMGIAYYKKLKLSFPNNDEGLKKFLQAYLACVAFVDDQIGKVINALNNSKFKNNTIVILTSDHGWQMGEKDYLYKNSPWDESTKIPFIIRHPNTSKTAKVEHPISLIDVYPTLMDVCNLKDTSGPNSKIELDGFSVRSFLNDPETNNWKGPNGALTVLGAGINKPIEGLGVSKNPGALWHIEIVKELDDAYIEKQNYSYRTKSWRYILYNNGKEELYNKVLDSNAWYNVADKVKYQNIKDKLKKEMYAIINHRN